LGEWGGDILRGGGYGDASPPSETIPQTELVFHDIVTFVHFLFVQ
jgi:hypothetical protein